MIMGSDPEYNACILITILITILTWSKVFFKSAYFGLLGSHPNLLAFTEYCAFFGWRMYSRIQCKKWSVGGWMQCYISRHQSSSKANQNVVIPQESLSSCDQVYRSMNDQLYLLFSILNSTHVCILLNDINSILLWPIAQKKHEMAHNLHHILILKDSLQMTEI